MQKIFETAHFAPETGAPALDWSGIDVASAKEARAPRWAGIATLCAGLVAIVSQGFVSSGL